MRDLVTKLVALTLSIGALAVTTNHDQRGGGPSDIHFGPIPNEESNDKEPN